jgi:hypothetical protein
LLPTPTIEVADFDTAQEWFLSRNMTDGLPVVPPTKDRVEQMIGGQRYGAEVIGYLNGRPNDPVTVEQIGVCSVMAGALPEYFPVIHATWRAILRPELNGVVTLGSSGGTAITALVSGPYASRIGMNSTRNIFGPGNRANATIGRAIRLGVMNALGYRPGAMDGSAFGNQARYTAHFAERTPGEPWLPFNVRLGYDSSETSVTVAVTDAPRQLHNMISSDASDILNMLAAGMKDPTHQGAGQGIPYIVVLGPEHELILRSAGYTQDDVIEYLEASTRMRPDELAAAGVPMTATGEPLQPVEHQEHVSYVGSDGKLPMASPGQIILTTAGGHGSGWSHVIFGYAYAAVSRPVTEKVEL